MVHDFVRFPELTNSQMQLYYFESPHKQIQEDFKAQVVKVHDGDTITVTMSERDFPFPIRMLNIDSPELNAPGGFASRDWLQERILNEEVDILIDKKQRVGKWGRLLGRIFHGGMDIGQEEIMLGWATTFENRREGQIPKIK